MGKTRTSFKPGQSGNPGGRPKTAGLAEYIRDKTRGCEELADIALEIARGTRMQKRTIVNNTGEFVDTENPPTIREQQAALEYLLNRTEGTPKQSTEISGPDGGPITIELVKYGDE